MDFTNGKAQKATSSLIILNLKIFLRLPLFELVENLIVSFELQDQVDNFVLRFQDICLDQSSKGKNDLPSFLEWWDEMKDDLVVVTPETNDSIWIMTFHKAKGLESPVVIIPFANFDLNTKYNSIFWTSRVPDNYSPYQLLPLSFEKGLMDTDFEEAYRHEFLEGMLEELNVTYVGFTRAKDKLYVFCESVKELGEGNKLNKLIRGVLEDPSFTYNKFWDSQLKEFRWGDEQLEAPKEREHTGVEELHSYTSVQALNNVRIRPESHRFFMLFDNDKSKKIRKGIVLHRIFEQLSTRDKLPEVVATLSNQGLVNHVDITELEKGVNQILEIPEIASWFEDGWKVYVEKSIVSEGEVFRPDRVIVRDDLVLVIDYKLGKKDPAHVRQVNEYAGLLRSMGFKNVEGRLLYFENREIVVVN